MQTLLRDFANRCLCGKAVSATKGNDGGKEDIILLLAKWGNATLLDCQILVGDYLAHIEYSLLAKAVAVLAGTLW